MKRPNDLKLSVKEHWERETCGTRYGDALDRREFFREISETRYRLEPFIPTFADFPSAAGKNILEIGVGAGADFSQWCQYAAKAEGVDLTEAAIALTNERLELLNTPTDRFHLQVADAEALPFPEDSFDIVYSWGVLHHTPDTETAFRDAYRVLAPGGELRCMIYHVRSWTAWMLAGRRAVRSRSLRMFSPRQAVFEDLESPGTKAYTVDEARDLVNRVGFSDFTISTRLGPGDLLTIRPSERYSGRGYRWVWKLYPRLFIRACGGRFGMNMMITATK